jgi:hypothetical protein
MSSLRASREEIEHEALARATSGMSLANWPAIFQGFMAKGIPESDIRPRENVLTYHAWRAVGRQVRRGEHGVKVTTMVPMTKKDEETGEAKPIGKRFCTAVVFHVSQTDPVQVGTPAKVNGGGL